jgi:hypothetical protein
VVAAAALTPDHDCSYTNNPPSGQAADLYVDCEIADYWNSTYGFDNYHVELHTKPYTQIFVTGLTGNALCEAYEVRQPSTYPTPPFAHPDMRCRFHNSEFADISMSTPVPFYNFQPASTWYHDIRIVPNDGAKSYKFIGCCSLGSGSPLGFDPAVATSVFWVSLRADTTSPEFSWWYTNSCIYVKIQPVRSQGVAGHCNFADGTQP